MRSLTPIRSLVAGVAAFDASAPFSMTEGAALALRVRWQRHGLQPGDESGVPEPSTWAMLLAGFGLLSMLGMRKRTGHRLIA